MSARALSRRHLVGGGLAAVAFAAAPQASALDTMELARLLAPTGRLRVGVYPGSPTSEVRSPDGEVHGVSVEIGRELARRLGVESVLVEFPRVAEVVEAIVRGEVDMTVTNMSPARAERVAFTEPLLGLELGFLVPATSNATEQADLGKPGRRIGVSEGSTSSGTLARLMPAVTIVQIPSMSAVIAALGNGSVDAFATNKSILYELSDHVPGSRVVAGRWGVEHLGLAYPKDRGTAAVWLASFIQDAQRSGLIAAAADRAGLRGRAGS